MHWIGYNMRIYFEELLTFTLVVMPVPFEFSLYMYAVWKLFPCIYVHIDDAALTFSRPRAS